MDKIDYSFCYVRPPERQATLIQCCRHISNIIPEKGTSPCADSIKIYNSVAHMKADGWIMIPFSNKWLCPECRGLTDG